MRSAVPATAPADRALVGTRISGREQRPRTLAGGRAGAAERKRRADYLRALEAREAARERLASAPAYIRACANNPDRERTYWLYTWDPADPSRKTRVPYTCGSWRCTECQGHAGHVLFARLQEAWRGLDSADVVFIVLTLDPAHHTTKPKLLDDVYRDFAGRQNVWMKRLRRWLKDEYGFDMGNRWASVTECHKSGVPHVNIALHHPEWSRDLRERRARLKSEGAVGFELEKMQPTLLRHAQECGFGWRCSAEPNRYGDTEAISGYLVKGVKRADAMHGEVAKLSQLPTMAPKNFRRLRAGKGFVPPKHRGKNTGTVIRRYRAPEGDEQTEPLSRPRIKGIAEWSPLAKRLLEEGLALPAELEAEHSEYVERTTAYWQEVQHCTRIEQELAWKELDGVRFERRSENIMTLSKQADGRTVAGRLVVIDVPRGPPVLGSHGTHRKDSAASPVGCVPPSLAGGCGPYSEETWQQPTQLKFPKWS